MQNLIAGVVVTFDDITALKQSERRLRCIFQDLADPIIVEDLDGIVLDMNEEAERIYGWERQELVGKPLKTIVPPEEHPHLDELLPAVPRTAGHPQYRRRTAAQGWFADQGFPVHEPAH